MIAQMMSLSRSAAAARGLRHHTGLVLHRGCHSEGPITESEFDRCMKDSLFAAARALCAPIVRMEASMGNLGLLQSVVESIQEKISLQQALPPRKLQNGDQKPMIALAYSGGCDSLALALLTHQWVSKSYSGERSGLLAIHVDHNLRAEAAAEADEALHTLEKLGIETTHETLNFEPGSTAMQEKLRKERYRCLQSVCLNTNLHILMTGHHLDDEVETIVMRQQRSTTLLGMSGTSVASKLSPTLSLIRPLISFPKARLQATCEKFGCNWIEDASNKSHKYTRNIVRDGLSAAATHGEEDSLTMESFYRLAHTLGDVGTQLQNRVTSLMDRYVTVNWTHGFAALNVEAMLTDDRTRTFRHHLLRAIAATIGNKENATGGKQFIELHRALERSLAFGAGRWRLPHAGGLAWTLVVSNGQAVLLAHGTVVKRSQQRTTLPLGTWSPWNDRWRVRLDITSTDTLAEEGFDLSGGFCVQPIDDRKWSELMRIDSSAFKDHLRGLSMPFEAKRSVPVFVDSGDQVIAIPNLGICRSASLRARSLFWPL